MRSPGLSHSESKDLRVFSGRDCLRHKSIEQRVSKLLPELRCTVAKTVNLRSCISGSLGRVAWAREQRHGRTSDLNRYQKQKQLQFQLHGLQSPERVFRVERFV